MLYGSDDAVMLRAIKASLFNQVHSPLLGWEVYARKENFYKETGIALVAGASKSVQANQTEELPFTNTPLSFALDNFLQNVTHIVNAIQDFKDAYGDDKQLLLEHLAKVPRQAAA